MIPGLWVHPPPRLRLSSLLSRTPRSRRFVPSSTRSLCLQRSCPVTPIYTQLHVPCTALHVLVKHRDSSASAPKRVYPYGVSSSHVSFNQFCRGITHSCFCISARRSSRILER